MYEYNIARIMKQSVKFYGFEMITLTMQAYVYTDKHTKYSQHIYMHAFHLKGKSKALHDYSAGTPVHFLVTTSQYS